MSNKEDDLQSLDELAAEGDEMDMISDEAFEEVEALKAERDDFRDKFMRALADAENTRKRADRDRREAENYGGSKLARDLLPVYDNMSRALTAANEGEEKVPAALLEGRKWATNLTPKCMKPCSRHPCPAQRQARSFRCRQAGLCCMTGYYGPRRLGCPQTLVRN